MATALCEQTPWVCWSTCRNLARGFQSRRCGCRFRSAQNARGARASNSQKRGGFGRVLHVGSEADRFVLVTSALVDPDALHGHRDPRKATEARDQLIARLLK